MEKKELQKISLKIFELQETLKLEVASEQQEEVLRKAEKQINAAIKLYRSKWPVTSLEKILSMVLLNFAVRSLQVADEQDINPLMKELEALEANLKTYLDTSVSE